MRLFLALSFFASTLSATTFFDPPNPTSATPVVAHVTIPPTLCTPRSVDVARNGASISITLNFPPCPVTPPGFVPFDFAVSLGVLPPGVYDVVTNGSLDRGTLVVRDAAPPFDVVPNVLLLSGGEIHLRSVGVPLLVCPNVCPPFTVSIDGKLVNVLTQTPDAIAVAAPPHAAGPVDVTIDRGPGLGAITATAALDYFDFNKVPDPAFFEPVVLPALVTGAGAFGSQWSTEASLFNDNDTALPVTSTLFNVLCFPICDTRPQPHSTVTMAGNAPFGAVFYAARPYAPRLFFDVLARDLSRQSEALGTEIPVARERDLYDRPLNILLVPTDPRYRVALRIFRTDGAPAVSFNIFSLYDGTHLEGGQLLLTAPTSNPMFTSRVIGDLVQMFPKIAGKGPLRIEIGQPSSRAGWALVSVTNNETQHVTVIAPH